MLRRALAGCGRSLLVLAVLTGAGVACAALGPFWGVVVLCGSLGVLILAGLVIDSLRDYPPPGTVDEPDEAANQPALFGDEGGTVV